MRSITEFCVEHFGEKAYRLSLDGGFTCPNRDGTVGTTGCTFCRDGSGDFAESHLLSIDEQIRRAKMRIGNKYRGNTFIAYYQSFTNTYAPAAQLRELYMSVITRKDIAGLSIATRPDCLPSDTVQLIGELNRIKPVWIELGLQTMHDETADAFGRGYKTYIYNDAIRILNGLGVHTITHMILGLPGETEEMMLETAEHIRYCKSGGLKIQMLNVLKNTLLGDRYLIEPFKLLTMEEYILLTAKIIKSMPQEMVLHRMTGDGARDALIAPNWVTDKKRVLNGIRMQVHTDKE